MKYIRKTRAPHEYRRWCRLIQGTANENYAALQNPQKRVVHWALLHEQGSLCAYTMQRIDDTSSHIEHVKPETVCREEGRGSDLNYGNLVACFPRDGMRRDYRYGAQCKADWWEDNGREFVSPLNDNCESRFHFNLEGEINPVDNNPAAVNTIRVLGLDHKSLTEERKNAIEEFIFGASDGLSRAEAETAVRRICDVTAGHFHVFCVAIRDALGEYIRLLTRGRVRQRFRGRR